MNAKIVPRNPHEQFPSMAGDGVSVLIRGNNLSFAEFTLLLLDITWAAYDSARFGIGVLSVFDDGCHVDKNMIHTD